MIHVKGRDYVMSDMVGAGTHVNQYLIYDVFQHEFNRYRHVAVTHHRSPTERNYVTLQYAKRPQQHTAVIAGSMTHEDAIVAALKSLLEWEAYHNEDR